MLVCSCGYVLVMVNRLCRVCCRCFFVMFVLFGFEVVRVLVWVWVMFLNMVFLWEVYFFIVLMRLGMRLVCCFSCMVMLFYVLLMWMFSCISELYVVYR